MNFFAVMVCLVEVGPIAANSARIESQLGYCFFGDYSDYTIFTSVIAALRNLMFREIKEVARFREF